MNRKFYTTVITVLTPIVRLLWRTKITGLENLPAEGGCVVCANHCHWLDAPYLAVNLRKRRITFLSKAEAISNRFTKWLLSDMIGAIPVNRGQADLAAVRACMKAVTDGGCLGIFPQGHRSRDNSPTPMLNGVSMIAVRANAPIVPVYIDGPYRLRKRVDVRIGKPVEIADLGRKFDSETLSEVTRRIETAIWSMREAE